MKPSHNLATKLGGIGLGTPRVSFRPSLRVQRTPSRNISSSQLSCHTFRTRTPTQASAQLKSSHQHPLRFSARHNSTMPPANFSPGSEGPETEAALAGLLSEGGGRWTLTADGQGIERNFKFKTFTKTWVYNTTFIRWTTHSPKGLSTKDIELARVCDTLAKDFGEIVETPSSATTTSTTTSAATAAASTEQKPEKPAGLVGLADQAVSAAGGDCGCGGPASTSTTNQKLSQG